MPSMNNFVVEWERFIMKVKVLAFFPAKRIDDSKNVRHEELSFLIQRIFEDCKEGLMAGSETFTTIIEWAFVELLKHPKVMKKAQDLDDVVGHQRIVDEKDVPQLKYLQAIVKETFHLHPPVPTLIPHENFESCEVGGYHVSAKSMILVNLWDIHRNPCAYENPLDFNPERFVGSVIDVKGNDFQLLPFGSGRRICPALSLGLIMVQIYLARLLHSFAWKLPREENIEELDMSEKSSLTTPKAIPLQVIPNARLPFHLYVTSQHI
ncbi:unnamed protein product [Sphagnum troendelagicum]|uniref:Cytochrome P450 n=1 Tax=Sphagnum troendelagicum TaxID=128251 RepID=A0ABP0UDC4_9BRYO